MSPLKLISRRVIEEALRAAAPAPLVRAALASPEVAETFASTRGGLVLSVGKAAGEMLSGALPWLSARQWDSYCVTKDQHPVPDGVPVCYAGHPYPDERSQDAARAVLARLSALPRGAGFLLLLSGGASSLLCAPRPPLTFAEKRALTRELMARGAPIEELNALRRALSLLKGGGLLRAAEHLSCAALVLSDVVSGSLATIGSGPLWPSGGETLRLRHLLDHYQLWPLAPRALAEMVEQTETPASPPPLHVLLGDRRFLWKGATAALSAEGFSYETLSDAWQGPAEELSAAFTAWYARQEENRSHTGDNNEGENERENERGVSLEKHTRAATGREEKPVAEKVRGVSRGKRALVVTGEPTLAVRGPGRGGRAQHLALSIARAIANNPRAAFLALASDGTDGPTDAAGAFVDGSTWDNISRAEMDPEIALFRFDSYEALGLVGARLALGPTGTNVNDLYVALYDEDEAQKDTRDHAEPPTGEAARLSS